MIDNKPFAMFFNASPRKGWNTYKMLEAAKAGAEEAGAITELVNLYDIKFPGCKSCFACKLKNAKTNSVCAIRDELRPILERARQADVLVLGSPLAPSNRFTPTIPISSQTTRATTSRSLTRQRSAPTALRSSPSTSQTPAPSANNSSRMRKPTFTDNVK
jgi:hypothetical protein